MQVWEPARTDQQDQGVHTRVWDEPSLGVALRRNVAFFGHPRGCPARSRGEQSEQAAKAARLKDVEDDLDLTHVGREAPQGHAGYKQQRLLSKQED